MNIREIIQNNNKYIYIFIIFIATILLILFIKTVFFSLKEGFNNNKKFPPISNKTYKFTLKDYYVKSAYNACNENQTNKNNYVSVNALKNCIRQGFRFLDFEIFSVNNKPVISTSYINNIKIKGSYNSIPFSEVINIINDYAFSNSTCPNPNDPLILNLRIKSKNQKIYSEMSDIFHNTLQKRLLGPEYSYIYTSLKNRKNIGDVYLKDLLGKVIIFINNNGSNSVEDTKLIEYINIACYTPFLRCLTYDKIKGTYEYKELIIYNKTKMTICLPNLSTNVINYPSTIPKVYGCQFVAMCVQNNDENMKQYNKFFNDNASAFVLKPAHLRTSIKNSNLLTIPKPPPKANSYASRSISSNFYKFKI